MVRYLTPEHPPLVFGTDRTAYLTESKRSFGSPTSNVFDHVRPKPIIPASSLSIEHNVPGARGPSPKRQAQLDRQAAAIAVRTHTGTQSAVVDVLARQEAAMQAGLTKHFSERSRIPVLSEEHPRDPTEFKTTYRRYMLEEPAQRQPDIQYRSQLHQRRNVITWEPLAAESSYERYRDPTSRPERMRPAGRLVVQSDPGTNIISGLPRPMPF